MGHVLGQRRRAADHGDTEFTEKFLSWCLGALVVVFFIVVKTVGGAAQKG